jgi:L-serine dehydratase
MSESSSVFDMIGPVMIGPSSSHTAGVVRIARVAHNMLGDIPGESQITFYNSFARTFEGHGSDRAVIAGLLGYNTDDVRIRDSFDYAKKAGLNCTFKSIGNASTFHPNTVQIEISKGNRKVELIGESRGGGVIRIVEVNEFNANFSASLHTVILLAKDVKGSIANIANILSNDNCNIASMTVSRKGKHHQSCLIIEMDSGIRELTLKYLNSLDWIFSVTYIPVIEL